MVMYSKNNRVPVAALPHAERYQGRTYTDASQWFPRIGEALGWAEVPDKPNADARWSSDDGEWKSKPGHNPATQKAPSWTGQAWNVASKTLAERQGEMIAAAKARYAEVADGGTSASIAPGVTIPVATEAKPVLKLTRALAYMTAEVLTSMAVVTTAGAPVSLTPVIAQAMLSAVDAHVAACEAAHNALVAAIMDEDADHDSLDLIDIAAGTIDGVGGWTS